MLYLAAWKRHKLIALEKIEYTLSVKICDDADVISEIKTLAQMYAFVPVVGVVLTECLEYPQLDSRSISVFLHRAYNLDSNFPLPLPIGSLNDFTKGSLSEQFCDLNYTRQQFPRLRGEDTHIDHQSKHLRRQCSDHLRHQPASVRCIAEEVSSNVRWSLEL